MLYDNHPVYLHHYHLPFAREPWKTLYVFQRLATTLLLVPVWAIIYSILPLRYRPRRSWSLRQIISTNFTRRIFRVTEVAGVTWQTRDPTIAPASYTLKETQFIWVDPLPASQRTGVLKAEAEYKRVGCYVWDEEQTPVTKSETRNRVKSSISGPSYKASPPPSDISHLSYHKNAEGRQVPLVGIFFHGGGYTHMSAHESANTSRIPRNLMNRHIFHRIFSVEYRLLQSAPFPAALQDAAAVYSHVILEYGLKKKPYKVILIGDSSGGNLALALARWIRDEGHLPTPDGLLLLSPSCDLSHAVPETLASYSSRPNAHTDFLVDTLEPRALLIRTFLGFPRRYWTDPVTPEEERHLMEAVHSEYVSPCSPFVLKRWEHVDIASGPQDTRSGAISVVRLLTHQENMAALLHQKPSGSEKLFAGFPKTLVVLGGAERLVHEVKNLVTAMEKDGVDVHLHTVPDAVHDVLMTQEGWWERDTVGKAWEAIALWADPL